MLVSFGSVHSAAPIVVELECPSVSMGGGQVGSTFVNIDCIWIVDLIDSVAINKSQAKLCSNHCCWTGSFVSIGISHISSAFDNFDHSWTVGLVVSIVF